MISLLKRLFIENWERKLISLILAIIIWFVMQYSMTETKTVHGVQVRMINVPHGKTIEGMAENGFLKEKISLDLLGNKDTLSLLTSKNLQVVLDATEKPDQWIATIEKKDLYCTNPDVDLTKAISKITSQEMIIKETKLISEKVPLHITDPIGEAPHGYQFLDVWPYQLYITLQGPEQTIRALKARGLKLSLNLNEITRSQLDAIQGEEGSDEVSFIVPDSMKKISIPQLSDQTVQIIDDPQAKLLRIDFSRQEFHPIGTSLPITVFFPPKHSSTINPDTYSISMNECVVKKSGIKVLSMPLFAHGISKDFLETVKDMIQITVIASPKSERENLLWSAQFIYPHELENRYVAKALAKLGNDPTGVLPHMREEYLRNRFRRYMNRFRFYTENRQKLNLKIELQADTISVLPDPSIKSNIELSCPPL